MKFKILLFLMLCCTAFGFSQTNSLKYPRISLTQNPYCLTCPRVLVQNQITGEISWINKTDLVSETTSGLQSVTDIDPNTSNVISTGGVGINTTNPQAALDVVSTASGVLDPRVTETQRDAMTVGAAQNGMRVFVTDGSNPGFYYYDHPSTSWKSVGGGIQNLQSVTDVGNETSNSILIVSDDKEGFKIQNSENEPLAVLGGNGGRGLLSLYNYATSGGFTLATDFLENGIQAQLPRGNLINSIQPYLPFSVNGIYADDEGNITVPTSSATNLTYTASPANGTVNSDTGNDATIPAGSTTNASLMLPADKTALNSAKAVNGIVTSNGSGGFTAATTTGSGSVVALQNSPGFLGAPTAPTASANTNNTQLATTAYADAKVANNMTSSATVAPSKDATIAYVQLEKANIFSDVTTFTSSGTGEQISNMQMIPANKALKGFNVSSVFIRPAGTGGSGNITIRCYVNTTNSLAGASQVSSTLMGATSTWVGISRMFPVEGTTLTSYPSGVSAPSDAVTTTGAATTTTVNMAANLWVIWTISPANAADTCAQKLSTADKF